MLPSKTILLIVQGCINVFCKNLTDTFYFSQFLHAGALHLPHTAKATQQRSSPLWTHTPDELQPGFCTFLTSSISVRGDSEPMTFIANVLNEVQRRIVG